MKTIHHNGEFWYIDRRSLPARLARWVIWFGGWEALGLIWRGRIAAPWPVSLLGHRVTFQGRWIDIRLGRSSLAIGWQQGRPREGGARWHAYVSRDGTPSSAHCWLHGAPPDVVIAAACRAERSREGLPLPAFTGD